MTLTQFSINRLITCKRVGVLLGESDSRTDPDCDGDICADPVQFIGIADAFIPSPYDRKTRLNDIMLMKLATSAKLNG